MSGRGCAGLDMLCGLLLGRGVVRGIWNLLTSRELRSIPGQNICASFLYLCVFLPLFIVHHHPSALLLKFSCCSPT